MSTANSKVSIHASSREDATYHWCRQDIRGAVSIHASSREDATFFSICTSTTYSFNPRVLAGGRDQATARLSPPSLFQSTRPRGRTRQRPIIVWRSEQSFNPRVLAGGRDTIFPVCSRYSRVSIHASSREDATIYRSSNGSCSSFNPRVLAGGRDGTAITEAQPRMFQSTRPRGRTRHGALS